MSLLYVSQEKTNYTKFSCLAISSLHRKTPIGKEREQQVPLPEKQVSTEIIFSFSRSHSTTEQGWKLWGLIRLNGYVLGSPETARQITSSSRNYWGRARLTGHARDEFLTSTVSSAVKSATRPGSSLNEKPAVLLTLVTWCLTAGHLLTLLPCNLDHSSKILFHNKMLKEFI